MRWLCEEKEENIQTCHGTRLPSIRKMFINLTNCPDVDGSFFLRLRLSVSKKPAMLFTAGYPTIGDQLTTQGSSDTSCSKKETLTTLTRDSVFKNRCPLCLSSSLSSRFVSQEYTQSVVLAMHLSRLISADFCLCCGNRKNNDFVSILIILAQK